MAIRKDNEEGEYRLVGYDTFEGEEYPLPGSYKELGEAQRAAQARLRELERTQPSSSSGGQSGIQDQVYILHPNGVKLRVLVKAQSPKSSESLKENNKNRLRRN